jgi:hypothetical protein
LDEDLPEPPLSAFFSDLAALPDDPASEPDDFASDPEDFSLAAEEPEEPEEPEESAAEAPFLDPLTAAALRLSVR